MTVGRSDLWLTLVAFAVTLTFASPAAILDSLANHAASRENDLTASTPNDAWDGAYDVRMEDPWSDGYPDMNAANLDDLADDDEKRAFNPWSGKRAFNPWSGKRAFNPWSGKRAFNPWSGKRAFNPWSGKRAFNPWSGKRAFNPWSGKRAFNPWSGKRSLSKVLQLSDEPTRRAFNPWSGKRSVDSWEEAEDGLALDTPQEKRQFTPWGGKRAFSPWSGKRSSV